MGVTAAELEVILRAKDEMSNVLKDARGNVEQHSKGIMGSLGDMAKTAVGFAMGGALVGGFKAIVGELGSFVTEAANAQKVEAQLDAVLKSTGAAAEAQAQAYANAQGKFMVVGQLSAAEQGKLQKSLDDTSFSLKQQQARLAEQEAAWAKSKTHTEGAGLAMEATRRKIADLEGNLGGLKSQLAGAGGQTVEMAKALGLTAPAARISKEEILALAESLSNVTGMEDDAIIGGQNMLLTFTAIGKDVFPLATETIMDMAVAMGSSDLKGSAIQLGKALQDPIAGVSALSKVGVNFTEAQKGVIKSLVESGDVAGAQTLILKELQVEFGGSARAAGETFAGQLKILQNKLGNVKETIGTALLPALTQLAGGLSSTLSNPAVMSAIQGLAAGLSTGLGNAITFVTGVFDHLDAVVATLTSGFISWEEGFVPLSEALQSLGIAAPVADFVERLAGSVSLAVFAFKEAGGGIDGLVAAIGVLLGDITGMDGAFGSVTATFGEMTSGIKTAVSTLWPQIKSSFTAGINTVLGVVKSVLPLIVSTVKQYLGMVTQVWGAVIPALLATAQTTFNSVLTLVKGVLPTILTTIKGVLNTIKSVWDTVWPTLQKTIETVFAQVQRIITTVMPVVTKIIQELGPVFDKVFAFIGQVVKDVAPFVMELVQKMAVFIGDQITKIAAWVNENMPLIKKTIETVLNAIKKIWDEVWPYLKVAVTIVFEVIKKAIGTALDVILGIFKVGMQLVNGDFAGAWETLQKTATRLLEGLKEIILTILGGIVTAITGKTGDFAQVGLDLVRGLWQGIVDRWNQLKEDVGGLFRGLIDWIRWLLGEHSPSTVMITIGRDLMGGFTIGIEGATPDVISAVAAAINDILDVFRGLPDLLKGLAAPPAPVDWAIWADAFKDAVEKIMEALFSVYDQPGGVKAGAIVLAKDLAPQIEAILRVFGNLADMLQSVAALEGKIPDLSGFQGALYEAVYAVINALQQITGAKGKDGGLNGGELVNLAASFSESVQQVLAIIRPAVDAMTAIATYTPVDNLPALMARWQENIFWVVYAVREAAKFWVGDVLVDARAFAAAAIDVVSLIKPAVDAITALADYTDTGDMGARMFAFRDSLFWLVYGIAEAAKFWQGEALTEARAFSAAAAEVIALIRPAVDAIAALTEYQVVQDMGTRMFQFRDNLFWVVYGLVEIAKFWVGDALDAAVAFSESAGKIVALIAPAVEAIAALTELGVIRDMGTRMYYFRDNLFWVVYGIAEVAKFWVGDALDAAVAFAGAAGKVVALIVPAIEAIVALASFKNIPMFDDNLFDNFVNWFEMVIVSIVRVADRFRGQSNQEAFGAAQAFATAVQGIIALINPAIEAIVALASFKNIAMFDDDLFDNFVNWFEMVVRVIIRIADRFRGASDQGALGAAQAFATAVGSVIALINPAIESITALAAFKNIAMFDDDLFDNFVNWFEMVVRSIIRIADRFQGESDQEAFGAAQVFAAAVGGVVALVKPGIEAIIELAAFKNIAMPDDSVFDNFINWFEMVVRSIVRIADRFAGTSDQEALGAAVTFGAAATSIIALISPAIEAIARLLDYKAEGLPEAIETFQADFTSVITGITALAKALTDTGKPQALKFQELAEDVAEAIEAGAAAVGSIQEGGSASAIGAIQAFVTAVTEGLASALGYLEGTFLPAWRSDWAQIAASVDAATASLGKFSTANSNVTSNIDPAIVGKSPPPLAKWMTAIAEATQLAADNMAGLRGRMSRPLAYATTIPARAESAAARVQEVANYALSYIDQRPVGGPADLLRVAELLEWRKRMRR